VTSHTSCLKFDRRIKLPGPEPAIVGCYMDIGLRAGRPHADTVSQQELVGSALRYRIFWSQASDVVLCTLAKVDWTLASLALMRV
jgi:hypothetical protein